MEQQEMLDKILSEVLDMKSQMSHFVTKDEAGASEDRIVTRIDGFVKLHETLDLALVSLRNKYERLEERLSLVEQQLGA